MSGRLFCRLLRTGALPIAAALLLLLSRCGLPEGAELSERLIVEAIGVDLVDGEYAVTLQTLDLHAAGAGADPNEQGEVTRVYRFTGASVARALQNVERVSGLTPLYSQARLFVLGRSFAGSDAAGPLDFLLREYHVRGDILVAAAEDAGALVGARFGDKSPGAELLEDAILSGGKTGACCEMRMFRFLNLLYSETDAAYCPVLGLQETPEKERPAPRLEGTAFFEDGRWAYTADEETTRGLLLLTGLPDTGTLFVKGSLGEYGLRIDSADTKLRFGRDKAGALTCEIGVKAVCDITEYVLSGEQEIGEAQVRDAGAAAQAATERLLRQSISYFYYGHRADVCRLKRRARLFYPKESAAFGEDLFSPKAAVISVDCSVTVRRTGKESLKYGRGSG